MKSEQRTWQFWVWGFVFVFLAHALAVLRFAEKETPAAAREQPRPFFYLSLDEASERQIAELTLGRDPTRFALPNPHGFSGGAWLRFRPETPTLTNSSAPPEWLTLSAKELGRTIDEYLATNRPSEEQLLASLRATKSIEFRTPDEPVLTRTTVKIDGPLAARKLVNAPPLPSAVHSDVLRTVVSVAVNGDGLVESASLLRESGSKKADQEALELALAFEFEPAPIRNVAERAAAAPTVGRIVFTWHVAAPTNGTATASAR
jgi:TonB family protein